MTKPPKQPIWQPTARTQAGRSEILAIMANAKAQGWAQSNPVHCSSPPRSGKKQNAQKCAQHLA